MKPLGNPRERVDSSSKYTERDYRNIKTCIPYGDPRSAVERGGNFVSGFNAFVPKMAQAKARIWSYLFICAEFV